MIFDTKYKFSIKNNHIYVSINNKEAIFIMVDFGFSAEGKLIIFNFDEAVKKTASIFPEN
jgi:hypothetical protein